VSHQPAISVLVPTYNSADYLPTTVRSIQAQTDRDFELVACDDGSTDHTLELLAEFAAQDSRVRIERNTENLGLHGNLVRMMHLARGRFLKIVMADDLLLPDALERLRAPLEADPQVILSTSRRIRIDERGQRLPDTAHLTTPIPTSGRIEGKALGNLLLEKQVNLVGEPSTVMFRKSDVVPEEAFCLAGQRYSALVDMAMWINLFARGDCYYEVDALSCYRQHGRQLGAAMQMVDRIEWMQLLIDAPSLGYLTDPAQEARALQHRIADTMAQGVVDISSGLAPLLHAVQPLIARLATLHGTAAPQVAEETVRLRERMAGNPTRIAEQIAAGAADVPIRVPAPRKADVATPSSSALEVAVVLAATNAESLTRTLAALTNSAQFSVTELLVLDAGVPAEALADLPAGTVVLPSAPEAAEHSWRSAVSTTRCEQALLLSDDVHLNRAFSDRPADVADVTGAAGQPDSYSGVCVLGARTALA
jgi:hypothetical protein